MRPQVVPPLASFWTPWELLGSHYAAEFVERSFAVLWPAEHVVIAVRDGA